MLRRGSCDRQEEEKVPEIMMDMAQETENKVAPIFEMNTSIFKDIV